MSELHQTIRDTVAEQQVTAILMKLISTAEDYASIMYPSSNELESLICLGANTLELLDLLH